MSYGNYEQHTRTGRRPGCSPLLFIIIAVGLFWIFSSGFGRRPALNPDRGQPPDWQEPASLPENRSTNNSRPKAHPDSGDWEMEEVPASKSSPSPLSTDPAKPESKKTNSGDWEMEEVETDKRTTDSNFKTSNPTNPDSKKTSSGDWELEEVDKDKTR